MKLPVRKKETKIGKQYAIIKDTNGLDLEALSSKVSYGGNAKHKKTPWWGGEPRPDTRGTLCPNEFHDKQVPLTDWLRDAVRKGAIDHRYEGDGSFPKHVWYMHGSILYEAKLDNSEKGTYHGYPLKDSKFWPRGYERIYGNV